MAQIRITSPQAVGNVAIYSYRARHRYISCLLGWKNRKTYSESNTERI